MAKNKSDIDKNEIIYYYSIKEKTVNKLVKQIKFYQKN